MGDKNPKKMNKKKKIIVAPVAESVAAPKPKSVKSVKTDFHTP